MKDKKIEELKPEDFKPIIEIKDYLYKGDIIYGVRYNEEWDSWILDDGDIHSTQNLKKDYEVRFLTCGELLEQGKQETKAEIVKLFDYEINNNFVGFETLKKLVKLKEEKECIKEALSKEAFPKYPYKNKFEMKKVIPVVIDSNSLKNMEEMAFEKGQMSKGIFTTSMNRKVCWEEGFEKGKQEAKKKINELEKTRDLLIEENNKLRDRIKQLEGGKGEK